MRMPSIKYSGPILFIVPVLVVVFAFSVLANWQGRRVVDDLTTQIVDQAAGRVELQVNGYLAEAVRMSDQNALLLNDGLLDPANVREWREGLVRQLVSNERVTSITFGNPQGDSTWVIRNPGDPFLEWAIKDAQTGEYLEAFELKDGEPIKRLRSIEYDPRKRPWYQAAIEAGKGAWSEVYSWPYGEGDDEMTLGISYAQPVHDEEGRLKGVIDSDLILEDVSGFLRKARATENAESFLVESDGSLIGCSADAPVVQGKNAGRIQAVDVAHGLSAAVAKAIEREQGGFNSIDGSRSFTVTYEDDDYRVEVRPMGNPWGLDWRLAVIVPEREVMGGVAGLRQRTWLIGGLIAFGALGLGILASLSLVRPVTRLADGVRRIAGGDLDTRVEVGGHREFELLSSELNAMTAGLRDRMRLRQSLSLAMEIQQKLLPDAPPVIPNLDIAGHSTYCDETGGDYYDFMELGETEGHQLILVVGDVMGHGIAAALLMATARGILRSRASSPGSLGGLLTHVNNLLVEDTGGERFMTMMIAVIDPDNRSVRLANAGHDAPIFYDSERDEFLELPDAGGLPLGLVPGEQYKETQQNDFREGQVLLIGTDGLWETHNAEGEVYGKERLRDVIRHHGTESADAIAQAVREDVERFRGSAHQADDVTFVLIRFL